MKTHICTVFIILLTSASMTVAATPYSPYYQGGHQGMQSPAPSGSAAAILEEGVKKLTTYIRSSKNPQDRARAIQYLKTEIAPYFDFGYMTQWAAGPAWRNMNAAQRSKMEGELAKSFLTILATNLSSYNNQKIRFFTPRGQRQGEKTVSAWILEQEGHITKLDFRFYRNKQGNWKIFDVKVAGNSAVSYYRNMFRQKLRYHQARASH